MWVNALWKMMLNRSTPNMCASITHIQTELLSTLKTTERHSTLQSNLSQHQSSHARWCHHVSGILARGTCDLSPAASRRFPMILDDTAGATCTWMLLGWPSLLTQCIDFDVNLYYTAIQNLVCGCGNVPQIIAESSDTPLIHCAQHVQQSIDMSIQPLAGLQCDPVQMAEVV